jgi:hypothetical protein
MGTFPAHDQPFGDAITNAHQVISIQNLLITKLFWCIPHQKWMGMALCEILKSFHSVQQCFDHFPMVKTPSNHHSTC